MSNEVQEESFLDRFAYNFSWSKAANVVALVVLFAFALVASGNDTSDDVDGLTNAVGTLSADVGALSADVANLPEPVEFDEAAFREEIVEIVELGVLEAANNASTSAQLAVMAAEDDIVAAVLDALLGPVDETVTPTATPEATETATPDGTPVSTTPEIPGYQMFVIVTRSGRANLRYDSGDNAAGFPIMLMTKPKVQFDEGTALLVTRAPVKADGDNWYFEVVGPERGKTFYVRVIDVEETFK